MLRGYRTSVCTLLLLLSCNGPAYAAALPEIFAPAPFPLVLSQWVTREFVAPGAERAVYRLQTTAGPLVVNIVRIDPRNPSVRFGTVLARDRIVSGGETISSMAARTHAVAGINADYFDIGNTNAPLGMLAQNGALVRTPSSRIALAVGRDRDIRFSAYAFHGSAHVNAGPPIAITGVNEWPPQGGASFLTPSYGVPAAAAQTLIAELTPLAGTNDSVPPGGRYRVSQIDNGTVPFVPSYGLALGPAAQQAGIVPDVGDIIDVNLATDPPLTGVLQAIGGGPALLTDGVAVDDPASPGYATRARRIPAAAAARLADGTLALVVVDGRRPATSVGVNRDELIALLTGLGATDAMQFDSGGSATLVARVLGDERATVLNEPSDGIERPVADGFFMYSDAPVGPPSRLVVRPSSIEALPDVAIPLQASVADAAGHALGVARGAWHVAGNVARIDDRDVLHVPGRPITTVLHVDRGGVSADVPLEIVPNVTRIVITPDRPNPDSGATVALHAQAFDLRGRPVETGDRVRWSALHGTIRSDGVFTAGPADGFVSAALGAIESSETIPVGRHVTPLASFAEADRSDWTFSTVPPGGPGRLDFTSQGTLLLRYDFTGSERAAYADAAISLGEPLSISCAIDGDGSGAGIRIAVIDRYGERTALTLVKTVDWTGAQRRDVRVPPALAPPLILRSIYAVGSLGPAPIKSAGVLGIRGCALSVPGAHPPGTALRLP